MESPPRLDLIRSRGTLDIALFMEGLIMKGLIFYQSTCPKFRYRNGKVLGTQPHPTRKSAFTHFFQILISLKSYLTGCPNSHTL